MARVRARAVARVSPLAMAKNDLNASLYMKNQLKIPGVGWWLN